MNATTTTANCYYIPDYPATKKAHYAGRIQTAKAIERGFSWYIFAAAILPTVAAIQAVGHFCILVLV